MLKKRVAFIGKMGSGKTSLSGKLVGTFGYKKISLADELKNDIIKYNLTPDGKIDKARDRAILQAYGQLRRGEVSRLNHWNGRVTISKDEVILKHWGRLPVSIGSYNVDYWVDEFIKKLNDDYETKIVNDDIRRMNELNILWKGHFFIVKVNVNDDIRKSRLIERDGSFDESTLNDISESEIDLLPYDVAIDNNDTFESAWNSLLDVI